MKSPIRPSVGGRGLLFDVAMAGAGDLWRIGYLVVYPRAKKGLKMEELAAVFHSFDSADFSAKAIQTKPKLPCSAIKSIVPLIASVV